MEEAQKGGGELPLDFSNVPLRVAQVEFVGVQRTKQDLLNAIVAPCLQAKSFGDLTHTLSSVSSSFDQFDLFKEHRFIIDRVSPGGAGGLGKDEDDRVVIRVDVKEKKFRLNAGTEIQRDGVGFGTGGVFYNVLGRGERVDVNASIGSHSSTPLSVNFRRPILPGMLAQASIRSTLEGTLDAAVKYKKRVHGLSASLSVPSKVLPSMEHVIAYSLDWRHIFGVVDGASPTTRLSAGHSLKSAVEHTMTYSTRDSAVFPTSGVFCKVHSQFAGLGGDVSFLRNELTFSAHRPIIPSSLVVLSASLRLGHVASAPLARPFAGKSDGKEAQSARRPLSIIDKYQMGGPLSVRGFALHSLGPRDGHDSIGGEAKVEGSLHLSFPVSSWASHVLRGHIFANGGILASADGAALAVAFPDAKASLGLCPPAASSSVSILEAVKRAHPNVSLGGGLLVKIGEGARVEVNLALPIRVQPGVTPLRGVQVGVGLEFL